MTTWREKTFLGLLVVLLFTAWLPQRLYLSLCEFGIFLLVAVWLARSFGRNLPLRAPVAVLTMLAIPCFGLLQLAAGTAAYPWKTAVATLDWFAFASVAWLAAQFTASTGFERMFRRALVVLGLVVGVVGALHWYSSVGLIAWLWPDPYQLRAAFPVLNHSHFAAFVELALAPAVWAAMQGPGENLGFRGPQANSHGKPDPFHTWAAAAMVCAVWAVGSRSGSAIVMVEVAGVILLSARFAPPGGFPWRRALTIIVPALVLVTGIGLQGLATRLAEPPRDDLRLIFARAAIGMVQARPLSGFGLGSFAAVYPAYEPEDVGLYVEHAHNDWLEWGAEGGLALPALFLALAVLALRRSFARPWYLGIVAVFVQAALEFPLHNSAIAAWQFAALGCAAARPVCRSSTRTL